MVTISYAITAVNEHEELERLLDQINKVIRDEDEIVVQLDSKVTPEVRVITEKFIDKTNCGYKVIYFDLNKDFATFKNNLKNNCNKDICIMIDADEFLSDELYALPEILELNPEFDLFLVPRINTVFNIGLSHVEKWGWNISKNENYISERELDMDNPIELDHYNLLKKFNLIIEE